MKHLTLWFVILYVLSGFNLCAQINSSGSDETRIKPKIKDFAEAKIFVFDCIHSFKELDSVKYQSILGITFFTDMEGTVKRYKLAFLNKKYKLSRKDFDFY